MRNDSGAPLKVVDAPKGVNTSTGQDDALGASRVAGTHGVSSSSKRADLALSNPRTGATAHAQSVSSLGGALEQFDASRDPSADNLQRVSHLAIGDRLSKLVGNVPVFTVGRAEMRTLAQGRVPLSPGREPAGFYDPIRHHIIALDEAMRDPKEASSLLLHEGAHAALKRTIDESPASLHLIDFLRTNALAVHFERGGEALDHYGLSAGLSPIDPRKAAHEFVSEAMSNPGFQRFLASIPVDQRMVRALGLQSTGRTVWDALIGATRRILGLSPADHTYLDATLRLGDHLLSMAETWAARPDKPSVGFRSSAPPPSPAMPPAAYKASPLSALLGTPTA